MNQSTSLVNSEIRVNSSSKFGVFIKKADIFYQDIEILFENGKPKLQTHCGVVLGLIMIMTLFLYGYMKAKTMLDF